MRIFPVRYLDRLALLVFLAGCGALGAEVDGRHVSPEAWTYLAGALVTVLGARHARRFEPPDPP